MENIKEKYSISKEGVVLNNINGKVVRPEQNNAGYLRVKLNNKRYFVHRLVAEAYVDGYFEGAIVNHKDCNKLNNIYTNLEWVTRSYNSKHAYINKRQPGAYVESKYEITFQNGNKIILEGSKRCAKYLGISRSSFFNRLLNYNGLIARSNIIVSRCVSNDYCESK